MKAKSHIPVVRLKILCFCNGNIGVFHDSEQVPELQAHGWLGAWLEKAESLGYNPEGWIIDLPDGQMKAKIFKVQDETLPYKFTWEIL